MSSSNPNELLRQAMQGGGRDFRGAYLRCANLSETDLRSADLRGANLRDADLSGANLSDANLSGADLRGANLSGANLHRANLRDANLRDANLRDANLSGANLSGANLSGANLSGAIWCGATIDGAVVGEGIGGPGSILCALTPAEWEQIRAGREEAGGGEAKVQDLEAEVERLRQAVCDECTREDGFPTGWKENRVEGRHPCACIAESEPYQAILAKVELLKAALRDYGEHRASCSFQPPISYQPCDCGLDDAFRGGPRR